MKDSVQKELSKKENLLRATSSLSGVEKIARVLLLLNKEEAAQLLHQFSDEEIPRIAQSLVAVKDISSEQKEALLTELKQERGGKEVARKILETALGKEKSETFLQNVTPEKNNSNFHFLEKIDIHTTMAVLENESPLTLSLLLTQISPSKASKILQRLPVSQQQVVTKRIARMKQVNAQVVQQLSAQFRHKLQRMDGKPVEIDGTARLASILRYTDTEQTQNILQALSPALSREISEHIFIPEVIYDIEDAQLQKFFREQDDKEIALFLNNKPPTIVHKVLKNLSQRRKILVKDEIDSLHVSPKKSVEETKIFLRKLQEWIKNRGVALLSPKEREEIYGTQ